MQFNDCEVAICFGTEAKEGCRSAKLVLDVSEVDQQHSYLLQRYSTQWMEFVDVISPIKIASGDKLRAVPLAPKKNGTLSTESEVRHLHIYRGALFQFQHKKVGP